MEESKYKSQIKSLRKNYVRFSLDLKPDVLEALREACKANGTTPTTEIKKFIMQYIAKNNWNDWENHNSDWPYKFGN